jgi:hypothetical protein
MSHFDVLRLATLHATDEKPAQFALRILLRVVQNLLQSGLADQDRNCISMDRAMRGVSASYSVGSSGILC